MALLGSSVDPRLFMQDYSGFTRAAEIQAQGMQNLGAAIGQGIKDFGEARQERKKLDAQIKADSASIESAMKLGDSLGIDIKSYLAPIQAKINDPNTTPMEAAAYGRAAAQGISNAFTLGIGAQDRATRLQQAGIEQQLRIADLEIKGRRTDIAEQTAIQGAKPTFDLQKATITSPDGETFERDIPYDKKKGMFFDPDAGKYIKDVNKWGFGEPSYVEGEAMPTPTSQNEIIAPSTAYSFGKAVGGPDELQDKWTNKGYTSTGPNLVEGVVAVNTNKYPLGTIFKDSESGKVYVAADRHGNKDSSVIDFFQNPENYTGGKVNKRLSIIGAIPKNKIPKTKKGMSQLIEQYSNVPDYSTSSNASQIDNAISMGGDMTQQAMGTPQQQAEIARMIQEGQSMQTAQDVPQGSMRTEPSISTQQPQQAQPQLRPRSGFVQVKPQGKQKEAKIITGEEAKALNLDPLGTYEASYQDGQLTSVQTLKAAPSVGDVIAMEKRQEEQVAKQQMAVATENKSTRMVDLMTELKNSPGFTNLFGANWYPKGLRGTPGADAAALFKQIESLGFMEAIKDMKGMGALSDAEGQKASAAFLGISPDMSEEAAKNKIDEVIRYIKKGQERIQTGNLIETKENKGPSIGGANSYFNQFNQPPAR